MKFNPLRYALVLLVLFKPAASLFGQANEPMHPILSISGSGSGASTVTNIA
jgi:hypothetical protein